MTTKRGFVYLFAVLDRASRRVVSWRLWNTLTTDFCLEAVQEAITWYGAPAIFNHRSRLPVHPRCAYEALERPSHPDQHGWPWVLTDNVFVERLWKSVQYEEVFGHSYDSVSEAKSGLEQYFTFCNQPRPHSALDDKTPVAFYCDNRSELPHVAWVQGTVRLHFRTEKFCPKQPEPPLSISGM